MTFEEYAAIVTAIANGESPVLSLEQIYEFLDAGVTYGRPLDEMTARYINTLFGQMSRPYSRKRVEPYAGRYRFVQRL